MEQRHTIIIAEAGVNHNGNYDMACRMIDVAANAGADYIKFQTAVPELVISRYADKAEYQKDTTGANECQLDMCRRIHLPLDAYASLARLCHDRKIGFLSTPFDLVSIEVLQRLDMDYFKVPSGEITNLPYLRRIAECRKPVIMSTGMSSVDEVEAAINVLENGGLSRCDVHLLHCTTQYPTPFEDVNLNAMRQLEALGCGSVGYSDHTLGLVVPVAAVAMGAKIIEKHFTLDRFLEGPDHRASLVPDELTEMVRQIRIVEQALGDGIKHIAESERANIAVARKSIVAARDIKKGEVFTADNITVKRPGTGISPMKWDEVIGQRAARDYIVDQLI